MEGTRRSNGVGGSFNGHFFYFSCVSVSFQFTRVYTRQLLFPMFFYPFRASRGPLLLLICGSFSPQRAYAREYTGSCISVPTGLRDRNFSNASCSLVFRFSTNRFLLVVFYFRFSRPCVPPSLLPRCPSFPIFPTVRGRPYP